MPWYQGPLQDHGLLLNDSLTNQRLPDGTDLRPVTSLVE